MFCSDGMNKSQPSTLFHAGTGLVVSDAKSLERTMRVACERNPFVRTIFHPSSRGCIGGAGFPFCLEAAETLSMCQTVFIGLLPKCCSTKSERIKRVVGVGVSSKLEVLHKASGIVGHAMRLSLAPVVRGKVQKASTLQIEHFDGDMQPVACVKLRTCTLGVCPMVSDLQTNPNWGCVPRICPTLADKPTDWGTIGPRSSRSNRPIRKLG